MREYWVFLYRDGSLLAFEGTSYNTNRVALAQRAPNVLSFWCQEADTRDDAIGQVLLKLYDQTQQPFQHVCSPCDREHVELKTVVDSRESCTYMHDTENCPACRERSLGL